jgi:type II secretory pathway pseudopilin PulG
VALIAMIIAGISAYSAAPRAQGSADRGKAQEALERTDEIIGGAKTVVEESRSQRARLSLDVASDIQAKAWNNFGNTGYRAALQLTAEAREEAYRAIALARSDRQFEQHQSRVAEETSERLIRLRDVMSENGIRDEQAIKLIGQSKALLEKSRLNAQQLRYQASLQLAASAEKLALRAEERVRNTRILKESVERRLALLERLIERSGDRVDEQSQDRVPLQLKIAENQLDRAHEQIEAGRYREAKQSLERCEKNLRNSLRLMPQLTPAGDPQERLDEALRLLERSREIIADEGSSDPKALGTLERPREMLARAEQAIAEGHDDEALRLVAAAREMLRSAVSVESGDLSRDRLMLRLEKVEALREETRNLAETCPVPGIRNLMERAQEHLRLARQHAESGASESAAEEIAVARNLYRRIGEICAR